MNSTGVKILVVDDDEFTAEMTGMMLEEAASGVVMALGGGEALRIIGEDPSIGLVVSDHNMPGMTGEELFREIRAVGCAHPFVLLTGSGADALRRANPGMDGVLAKDENLVEELTGLVARILEGSR